MSNHTFTLDSFSTHLTRAFAPRCAPGDAPRAVTDTSDKGKAILEFYLPNPHDLRRSVSLTASDNHGTITSCSLWFGQVEISSNLSPEDAVPAIEEIIAGHIVAIIRYKNRNAYDNRRKGSGKPGAGRAEWLYQLPDDASALAAMTETLRTPAGLWNKLSGTLTGVFEIYGWDSIEVLER